MSDELAADLVDKMMVKCARRCCICRRFRPTKLQVHHIKERSQGGTDHEDNLIVVCLSCHTDVHSKVPFARRFSQAELKGHRDAMVSMVAEGKFPTLDTDDASEAMALLLRTPPNSLGGLSPEATEILLRAANTTGEEQGNVLVSLDFEGLTIKMGDTSRRLGRDDPRDQAKFKRAIKELVRADLLEELSEDVLEVTDVGYLAADEIMVSQSQTSPTR